MGRIIAVANQKGGVGKTTTAVNLAYALFDDGERVLLCDCDPQGNATSSVGVKKNKVEHSMYDVLIQGTPIEQAIVKTKYCHIVPANKQLSGAGIELVSVPEREYVLKKALAAVKSRYDFIIIDCPPSLELMTINSLCAADGVLVPVQCEYFALEGLSDLINIVRLTKRGLNPSLDIDGVLLTMYDGRPNLSLQVAEEVKKYFGAKLYSSVIPRNVRISEAPSHGKPVIAYDKGSKGAKAYEQLAQEVIKRAKKIKTGK